jgi:O-antigen/teichoic acid export membrane protein
MGFLFVPLYLKYLGAESYGLVGFWATLTGVFAVLDLGVCATLNREIARLSAEVDGIRKMVDLLYTLERINWGVALIVGVTVMILSDPIARYWVNVQNLPTATVRQAVLLIGLILLFQWPYTLYSNGLNGLQRQVLQNVITVSMTALKNVGVLVVLAWVTPTIQGFFIWQVGVCVFQLIVSRSVLWRGLESTQGSRRFQIDALRSVWRFALGMSGISLVTMLLTQADRILLSKMISLEQFGYYSLAVAVSTALGMLVGPVFTAAYPRLSQLVAQRDSQRITDLYHRCCQIVAVSTLPSAVLLSLFSTEILLLWTHSTETTARVHLLVRVLVIGTALNGLMNIPYALQLATGWTSLAFRMNLISVLVLVPTMVGLVWLWGAIGAAVTWVLLNSGYVLIGIQVMHRRLLPGQQWRWYGHDVVLPASAALFVGLVGRLILPPDLPPVYMVPSLLLILALSSVAAAVAAPAIRQSLSERLPYIRSLFWHG